MTCEQFRSNTAASPSTFTRAERAATVGHYQTCEQCRAWAVGAVRRAFASGSLADAVAATARGLAIGAEDRRDPEYMAVAYPQAACN